MSEKTKKQNTSHNQQPKQDRAEKSVRTVLDDSVLSTEFGPLLLCGNTGKPLFLLYNRPHLPYQRHALPFCKTIPELHPLLAGLKTAQSFLFLQTQLLSAILPEEYHSICVEFACDMAFPEIESVAAFRKWKPEHPDLPMTVDGIGIVDIKGRVCRLHLDLTFAHSSRAVDYSKCFSYRFYEPLLVAIRAYNDVVLELHKTGFTVFPANFADCLSGVSDHFGMKGVPVVDI